LEYLPVSVSVISAADASVFASDIVDISPSLDG
jgi:hypothetical protein